MTPLSEVAADVAKAFGLTLRHYAGEVFYEDLKNRNTITINVNGNGLTTGFWFKACCEWLRHAGYTICLGPAWGIVHNARGDNLAEVPISAEAPARLVSAVWRATTI